MVSHIRIRIFFMNINMNYLEYGLIGILYFDLFIRIYDKYKIEIYFYYSYLTSPNAELKEWTDTSNPDIWDKYDGL